MDQFKEFHRIAQNPAEYARDWKQRTGKPVIGSLCSYAPEEVLLAAGVLGYRIFGTGAEVSKADSHMQAYSCSLVRGALEETLTGGLEFLDGVVFPHTCDSVMRLSDIWRMNIKSMFHLDLVMPVKLTTESSRQYMIDVFKRFKQELETALGTEISEEDLKQAVEVGEKIRQVMKKLYSIIKIY